MRKKSIEMLKSNLKWRQEFNYKYRLIFKMKFHFTKVKKNQKDKNKS